MANTVTFVGYSKGTGRNPFLRLYAVTFSGNYAQNNVEVINFALALNPNGIEDMQVPNSISPSIPPLVLASTTGGYQTELQIGGTGTAGQYGIRFYASGATELGAVAYSGVFPANGTSYGLVVIGIMDAAG
jgi:hypothetical protein